MRNLRTKNPSDNRLLAMTKMEHQDRAKVQTGYREINGMIFWKSNIIRLKFKGDLMIREDIRTRDSVLMLLLTCQSLVSEQNVCSLRKH